MSFGLSLPLVASFFYICTMVLPEQLKQEMSYVMSLIRLELQSTLEKQGYGTKEKSKLQQTMSYEIELVATTIVASMYMEDYFVYVENETPPESIPFSGTRKGSGAKTSKYIQGLYTYWRRKRGLRPKEALRASFATAHVHKKKGRPNSNSKRFSKNGKRTGFIENTLKAIEGRVFDILERRVGSAIELTFTRMLEDLSRSSDLIKLATA